jgi:hypothetical protein
MYRYQGRPHRVVTNSKGNFDHNVLKSISFHICFSIRLLKFRVNLRLFKSYYCTTRNYEQFGLFNNFNRVLVLPARLPKEPSYCRKVPWSNRRVYRGIRGSSTSSKVLYSSTRVHCNFFVCPFIVTRHTALGSCCRS